MLHRIQTTALVLLSATALMAGCKSEKENTVVQPPPLPIANFTMSGSNIVPTTIGFLNFSENADRFQWDFGDSTTSTEVNPSHAYVDPGTYQIVLTAIDSATARSNLCAKSLILLPTPEPIADFSWTGSTIAPAYIRFVNNSQNATEFLWDFSDGRTSTHRSPNVDFYDYGSYLITLIASDPATAKSDTAQKTLVITPSFLTLDSICVDSLAFTDTLGHNWDASNGPDLFYNLRDHNSVLISTSIGAPVLNIAADSLPIGWEMPDSLMLTDWGSDYRLELFDEDNADADDRMEVFRFSVANLATEQGYVRSLVLTKGGFRVRLRVRWE